eukprot:5192620-Pyramimonas_sp.AAC.1
MTAVLSAKLSPRLADPCLRTSALSTACDFAALWLPMILALASSNPGPRERRGRTGRPGHELAKHRVDDWLGDAVRSARSSRE